MKNNRKKYFKKGELNNLGLKKPNTKARRVLLFFEIILVFLVLFGTGFGLVRLYDFSPTQVIKDYVFKVAPISPVPPEEIKEEDKTEVIIEALPEELFGLKEVKSRTSEELVLISKQGTQATFSLNKSVENQLTTLQNLLTKAKISNKKIKKIDLRFEKVVVTYAK